MQARESIESAFTSARPKIFALAYRITGSASDAEDIAQESFARALQSPPGAQVPLEAWLVRVASNLAKDALRRRRTRSYFGPWLPEPVEDARLNALAFATPESRYSLAESATLAFLCALEALGPTERSVLVLRDALGLDVREVAEVLGTSEGNVRVVHHRARKKLSGYDAQRCIPSDETKQRTERALLALMQAMGTGSIADVVSLLADDATLITDAAGEFTAAVLVLHGSERIARAELQIAKQAIITSATLTYVNGLPALAITLAPKRRSDAPASLFTIETNNEGRIVSLRHVLASKKLRWVRFA